MAVANYYWILCGFSVIAVPVFNNPLAGFVFCLKEVETIKLYKRVTMRFLWRIISITLILIITYFIVDVGRYFIYPNVAALKKAVLKKQLLWSTGKRSGQKKE